MHPKPKPRTNCRGGEGSAICTTSNTPFNNLFALHGLAGQCMSCSPWLNLCLFTAHHEVRQYLAYIGQNRIGHKGKVTYVSWHRACTSPMSFLFLSSPKCCSLHAQPTSGLSACICHGFSEKKACFFAVDGLCLKVKICSQRVMVCARE